jgi:hypothetical protein
VRSSLLDVLDKVPEADDATVRRRRETLDIDGRSWEGDDGSGSGRSESRSGSGWGKSGWSWSLGGLRIAVQCVKKVDDVPD